MSGPGLAPAPTEERSQVPPSQRERDNTATFAALHPEASPERWSLVTKVSRSGGSEVGTWTGLVFLKIFHLQEA